jgi:hypothetical protein
MGKKSTSLAELVSRLPDPDQRGMYCTDIDKDRIEKTIAEIYNGGRKNIIGIIDMLVSPGEGNDVKSHYALHCLVLHVCKLNDDNQRREFAKTLASQLGGNRPKAVQRYLVRELQVVGVEEVTETIGKLLTDEELCEPAAQALIAIGDGATEQLRKALPKVKGKCRLTVIQNLGVVHDGKSISALKKALRDGNREFRLVAAWALANIGDAGSADALLKAANAEGWERIKATKACLLLAEKLLAAGRKNEAVKIYKHLQDTRTNPAESYVRDAAKSALAAVTSRM